MDYSKLLNEQQLKAVSTQCQYARIIAGAGSGKTRVLTYRISYLISEMNVDPSKIVAIAFTNKVANEMKERALKLLNGLGTSVTVSTFHSWCAKFLRKEIDVIGFPNNFTIMDDEDQEQLVKNIGVDLGYKKNDDMVKYALGYICGNKCKGLYPQDITTKDYSSEKEKKALRFYHLYEERKNEMLLLDFDDLLLKTIQILTDFPEIREKWHNRIEHILVDEFQDTNDVQFKLIQLLMSESTNLYVVGDPDQTIYTWRGANQDIILKFNSTYPLAETYILDRNYRSTKTILNHANKLIAHNKKRVPKDLYTEESTGCPVVVTSSFSREAEAKNVANQIVSILKNNPGITYKDIAILYRAAYLTLPFEKEFMARQIPYKIYGGMKFFQRKEVKDVLAYFRLIYNPKDDVSFERVINVPRRGIGDTTLEILKCEKNNLGLSYLEYIDEIEKHQTELKVKNVIVLTALREKIADTRRKLKENLEVYPKVLEDFIRELGYFDYLASDDENAEDRIGYVNSLFDDIQAFFKNNPESSFETYLENASLQTSQDEITDANSVSLMTVHVAKGLEFNYVFVVSMIEGVFPSERAKIESGQNGLEEERRIAYVAFTRAKKCLYVSTNAAYSFVLAENSKPSIFIKEAGLELPEKDVFQPSSRRVLYKSQDYGYYPDQSYDDFSEPIFEEEPKPKDNGVRDWQVGDIAIHDVFGRGIVTGIIDGTILEINFESQGKKSILATHIKLHKEVKGVQA